MIYLSAGHSTVDPGAVTEILGPDGKKLIRKEADIVSEFRNLVSFYLLRAGVPHDVDGIGTENIPLAATVKEVKGHHPALEFHCNAGVPAATGVESLQGAKDLDLAKKICQALADAFKIRNRGAKPENSGQHHRLAFVQAGGIIVELFFLSNVTDLKSYDDRKWVAAKAVAEILMKG